MSSDLPAPLELVLEEYARHLGLERGRSQHTVKAYVADAKSLLQHWLSTSPEAHLGELDIQVLRSWLAGQSAAGIARTTLARRTSSVRNFTAWLLRTRRIATDPGARLGAAKAHRTLPPVLRQSQAADAMDAAESGAQQNDPIALRDRLIVELLYATGIRVGELCGLDLGSVDRERRLLRVIGKGDKERSVPYGKPAADAVDLWLHVGRPAVATDSDTAADPWGQQSWDGPAPEPSRHQVTSQDLVADALLKRARRAPSRGWRRGLHRLTGDR